MKSPSSLIYKTYYRKRVVGICPPLTYFEALNIQSLESKKTLRGKDYRRLMFLAVPGLYAFSCHPYSLILW